MSGHRPQYFVVFISLAFGNYAYQFLASGDWTDAFHATWANGVAISGCALSGWLSRTAGRP